MFGDDAGRELVVAPIGRLRVALPADQVLGVDLGGDLPHTDLFDWLQIDREGRAKRAIRIGPHGRFDLVVAPGLRVLRYRDVDIQPLPRFLAGLQRPLGLVGLAAHDGGFALVVDPAALEPA